MGPPAIGRRFAKMHARVPHRTDTSVKDLTLLLSGRCNLACAYCYQTARSCSERLSWEGARAALDHLLASRARFCTVEFSGGEPLLEWDLLIRCVEHAEARRRKGQPLNYLLTTNGTLLTPGRLDWLDAHRFSLRLSFDGPGGQARRAAGSFERLDALLDGIRADQPSLFGRLRVHAAVLPSTVASFAESAVYFLEKGVPEVFFYPVVGGGEPWPLDRIAELRTQVARIVERSVRRFEDEGMVPVLFLQGGAPAGLACPDGGALCGASRGEGFCVDPDGRAWSCPFFAGSLSDAGPVARDAVRAVDLGDVAAAEFYSRLAALPSRTAAVRLLTGRERKRSGYRACAECAFLAGCGVCPAAAAAENREGDPDRVSDFACAFSTATLEGRRHFDERTGGGERRLQMERLRRTAYALTEALRRAGT